jgi:hypothetical protein
MPALGFRRTTRGSSVEEEPADPCAQAAAGGARNASRRRRRPRDCGPPERLQILVIAEDPPDAFR